MRHLSFDLHQRGFDATEISRCLGLQTPSCLYLLGVAEIKPLIDIISDDVQPVTGSLKVQSNACEASPDLLTSKEKVRGAVVPLKFTRDSGVRGGNTLLASETK